MESPTPGGQSAQGQRLSPPGILMTGATGFLGSRMIRLLTDAGYAVTAFSRKPPPPTVNPDKTGTTEATVPAESGNTRAPHWIAWDGRSALPPGTFAGIGAIVHLAGAPLMPGRWTEMAKQRHRESRAGMARALVRSLAASPHRPQVIVSASGMGYYGPVVGREAEETDPPGGDYLAGLAADWESAVAEAETLGLRRVSLRFGMILGPGGAYPLMALPFRFGLGGVLGDGLPGLPWIHLDDALGLLRFALEHPALSGPVNAVAPEAVSQAEFYRALGRSLRRPVFFRVPEFCLRLALGEAADLLLHGQTAKPGKILDAGYRFRHPRLDEALAGLADGHSR